MAPFRFKFGHRDVEFSYDPASRRVHLFYGAAHLPRSAWNHRYEFGLEELELILLCAHGLSTWLDAAKREPPPKPPKPPADPRPPSKRYPMRTILICEDCKKRNVKRVADGVLECESCGFRAPDPASAPPC